MQLSMVNNFVKLSKSLNYIILFVWLVRAMGSVYMYGLHRGSRMDSTDNLMNSKVSQQGAFQVSQLKVGLNNYYVSQE